MKGVALHSATLGSGPHHAALLPSWAKERHRGLGPSKDSSVFGTAEPSGLSEAVLPGTSSCGLLLGLGESLLPSLGPQRAGENEAVDPQAMAAPGAVLEPAQSAPARALNPQMPLQVAARFRRGGGRGCRPSQAPGARRLCFTVALPTGRTKDILKRAPLGSQDRPEVGSQCGLCGPSEGPRPQTRFRTDHSAYAKERSRLPGVFPSFPQRQEGLATWQEGWGSSLPSRSRAEGQRTATDASGHWVRGPEQGQA